MKSIKKATVFFLVFSTLSLSFQSAFAQPDICESEDVKQVTELKQHSEEDANWMENHTTKVKEVLLNKIALERINEVRLEKGLEILDPDIAVPIGQEIVTDDFSVNTNIVSASAAVSGQKSQMYSLTAASASSSNYQATQASILTAVDNSKLKYFPPIKNQGSLNSCASFAEAYYQATHMNAMARDWNVKADTDNSKKFSPLWSFNLRNGGKNEGVSGNYQLYFEQGIALWKDFPYEENHTKWPTNPDVWKNARNFMPDRIGVFEIIDGTDTPVKNEKDQILNNVKQLLSNGYIFTFNTDIHDWNYKPIKAASDQSNIGRAACYMRDDHSASNGSHDMTIVGYDDNIWVDINNNGIVDTGEKGAFKIANSWGDKWEPQMDDGSVTGKGDGFVWLCYDALNKVSAVNGGPKGVNKREFALGQRNNVTWVTYKSSYTPSLMAEINITIPKRNQIKYELGYSEIYETSPSQTIEPIVINSYSGDQSFSGSIMLDYTRLFYGRDLTQTPKKWYIKITDIEPDGVKAKINSFNLYDLKNNKVIKYSNTAMNLTVDDKTGTNFIILELQYKPEAEEMLGYQWTINKGINENLDVSYVGGGILNYNGKLYVLAKNNKGTSGKEGAILEYNTTTGQWSIFRYISKSFGRLDQAVVCNGKLYVFMGSDAYVYKMEKNGTDFDLVMLPHPGPKNLYSVAAPGNGKIYLIGGTDYSSKIYNTIYEYNTVSNTWSQAPVAYLKQSVYGAGSTALGGKIYIMGGTTANGKYCSVEMYDPAASSGTTQVVSSLPDTVSPYRYECKPISLNNRIYLLVSDLGFCYIYEFNPQGSKWEEKECSPANMQTINAGEFSGKIYVMSEDSKNILEFNPVPVIPKPVFSIASGTYNSIQTVSINCITKGVTIRYTTDGTNPTSTSPVYTGPITVAGTKTIKAYASKSGMTNSDVASATYTLAFRVGDINGDGFINNSDVDLLKSYLLNSNTKIPVDDILWVADVDGNGDINVLDLSYLQKYVSGNITSFPKEG
ncbi:MAG TPA: chitobiase/beta-hexosaminidase C-terminal domain-containing protein [Pseudobacteroides sp.]|nr:chitobiase/beta-hexosaminidase C-terminal domain-containing protein [Pseudobacteroides sp.]